MSHGLAPRPALAPEELAAVVAAAQEFLDTRSRVVADSVPRWRFSGRWFNDGPFTNRRPNLS